MILLKKQVAAKVLVGVAVVGVAFSPVMASALTEDTLVTATVGSAISVATSETVNISVTPVDGGAIGTGDDTVTVSSNDVDGYTLSVANDTTLTMTGSQGGTLNPAAGDVTTPAALGVNTWGYRTSDFAADTYAKVDSTLSTLKTTASAASGDATVVTYGVNADLSLPDGTYSDTVIYTAVVN